MEKNHTIEETSVLTGISKSRLRYIEARFPVTLNRSIFVEEGRFYSNKQLDKFKSIDSLIKRNNNSLVLLLNENSISNAAKFIVIASGKGGVGKTSMSVNLSLLAAKRGFKTVLIDGDFGMANAHVLLGIKTKKDIANLIYDDATIDDVLCSSFYGLKFIAGGNGTFDLANLNGKALSMLETKFKSLRSQSEYIIIDSPAGIGKSVLKWIGTSDQLIVVTTPSPTALLDAYGLIKVSLEKGCASRIQVIVNLVNNKTQGVQVFNSLNQCTKKFLDFSLEYLGSVRKDSKIEKALLSKTPIVTNSDNNGAASNLNEISKKIFKN